MKKIIVFLFIFCVFVTSAFGATEKEIRGLLSKKDYGSIITLLEGKSSSAFDYYVLGLAYFNSNQKDKAAAPWEKFISLETGKTSGKYEAVYPPENSPFWNKYKTEDERIKIRKQFLTTFQKNYDEVSAFATRKNSDEIKKQQNIAASAKIEEKRFNDKAAVAEKTIQKKEEIIEKRQSSSQRYHEPAVSVSHGTTAQVSSSSSVTGIIIKTLCFIILIAFTLVVIFIIIKKDNEVVVATPTVIVNPSTSSYGSQNRPMPPYYPTSSQPTRQLPGTIRKTVVINNDPFIDGPFWYMGMYFASQDMFYRQYGLHYTNAMYHNNFDMYGLGQGRDLNKDEELFRSLDVAERLRDGAIDQQAIQDHAELKVDNLHDENAGIATARAQLAADIADDDTFRDTDKKLDLTNFEEESDLDLSDDTPIEEERDLDLSDDEPEPEPESNEIDLSSDSENY